MRSKVLLVSVDFPPHKDGVSSVSEALARKLVDDGHRLWVIGPASPGGRDYDRRQPFRVLRSPWYDWGYLRFVPLAVLFVFALLRWRPRHVFAMNIAYGGVLSYFFRFLGYRYYLWAYGYEFHKVQRNGFLRRLYLKIYRAAQKVFVITRFVESRLREFGVPLDKMQLIYPAVDPEKFRPLDLSKPPGEKVILSVSRLVERKGQDQVLRAMPLLLKAVPEARCWIAGEGPMRPALEKLARELGVAEKVRFLGKVQDEALVRLYNLCDVFAMPSKECPDSGHVEGFGIVFLEANACGKPVVGGRSGGMPEAIEEGKSGLLVDPQNLGDLARALERLLTNPQLAQDLGMYGRQRVLDSFDWKHTLQALSLEEIPKVASPRVVLLTRTSRPSGAKMAEALRAAGVGLVGIVAERRSQLLIGRRGMLRAVRDILVQHGLAFVAQKAWEQLRMALLRSPHHSVEAWAAKSDIPLFVVDDHNGLQSRWHIQNFNPELIVVCNTRKLKPETFRIARKGALNLHLSLLPRYAGLDSIFWVLYHREKELGFSIHRVAEDLDAGDVLYQEKKAIGDPSQEETLYEELIDRGCKAMAHVVLHLDGFQGNARTQNAGPGSYFSWPTVQQRAWFYRYRRELSSKRPLKILHLITRMVRGGAQENTLATVTGLRERGYDAVLATGPSEGSEGSMEADIKEAAVPCTQWESLVRSVSPVKDIRTLIGLVRWMRREKFLIVHTHTSKAGVLGRIAAILAGVPIRVHTPHGHVFGGYFHSAVTRLFAWIERLLARKTDALIALTDAEKREHLLLGIGREDRFVTIPSGVRQGDFDGSAQSDGVRQELGIPHGSRVVGTLARLVPVKGVEYLLDAFRRASTSRPGLFCLIVGDGPGKEALQRLAGEYGIARNVVFAGYRRDVARMLSAMDVFVMASLNEGMGRAIVQAGLMRRAIVATSVSGIQDLIAHEENGLLVPPRNAEALGAGIGRLLDDDSLSVRLGRRARERFLDAYSQECMVENIEGLYEDLLKQKGIPGNWLRTTSLRIPAVPGRTEAIPKSNQTASLFCSSQ